MHFIDYIYRLIMRKSKNSVGLSEFIPAIAGAIAGCTSRMIIAPLDVVKIRYQVQFANKGPYYEIYQSIRHIINTEGYSVRYNKYYEYN